MSAIDFYPEVSGTDPRAQLMSGLLHMPELARSVPVPPEHLVQPAYVKLFTTLREPSEETSLQAIAENTGLWLPWLAELQALSFSASRREIESAARKVSENYHRLAVTDAATKVSGEWSRLSLSEVCQRLEMVCREARLATPASYRMAGDIAEEYLNSASHTAMTIATGFEDLDRILTGGGFPVGLPHCILASTNTGKTAFIGQIALRTAQLGIPVVFATLEDRPRDIFARMLAVDAQISNTGAQTCNFGGASIRVRQHIEQLRKLPIAFIDKREAHIDRFVPAVLRAQHDIQARAIFVDYAQRVRGRGGQSIYDRMVETVGRIVDLSAETGAAVIYTSQRNDKDGNRSAKGAGELTEEAATAIILERKNKYCGGPPKHGAEPLPVIECTVSKQKNGPRAALLLKWLPAMCMFADCDISTQEMYLRAEEHRA